MTTMTTVTDNRHPVIRRICNALSVFSAWMSIGCIGIIAIINILFTLCYKSPYSLRSPYFDWMTSILSGIIAAVIIYAIMKANNRIMAIKLRTLAIIACIMTAVLAVIWISATQYVATTDSKSILLTAIDTVNGTGDKSAKPYIYMERYPYQSGVMLTMLPFAYMLRAFDWKTIYIVLEYFNIIPVVLTVLLTILISKEIGGEKSAKMTAMLSSAFIVIPMTAMQYYGNILSLPMVMFTMLTLIRISKNIDGMRMGKALLLSAGLIIMFLVMGFIKQNNMITGIAISITMILFTLKTLSTTPCRGSTAVRNTVIIMLAALTAVPAMYAGEQIGIAIAKDVSGHEFSSESRQPMKAFVAMGLDDKSDHGPGYYYGKIGHANVPIKETIRRSDEILANSMDTLRTNPASLAWFLTRKTVYTWSDPTFSYAIRLGTTLYNEATKRNTVLHETASQKAIDSNVFMLSTRTWLDAICMILSICMLMGACKSRFDPVYMMPALAALGGFLFHIIWETQPEYAYTYFMLLMPYAGIGFNDFISWVAGRRMVKSKDIIHA